MKSEFASGLDLTVVPHIGDDFVERFVMPKHGSMKRLLDYGKSHENH